MTTQFSDFYNSLDPDPLKRGKQFERFVKWFLNTRQALNSIAVRAEPVEAQESIEIYINEDNARNECCRMKTHRIVIPAKAGIQLDKQSPRSGQSRVRGVVPLRGSIRESL